jgi:hypothetical protein
MFRFRGKPDRVFENIDDALETAEAECLDVAIIVDDVGDVLVKRWHGGRLEYPVGAFSPEESASLSLLRHRVA